MLRFPCLVLDHDDTVVQSTPSVNYPSFVESMKILRPELHMPLDEFLRLSYDPGFFPLCTDILKLNVEELEFEGKFWRDYARNHLPLPYPGFKELLRDYRAAGGVICVASHSSDENILRDYRNHFGMLPDRIYSSDLPPHQRKPEPFALLDIMEHYGFSPEQMLMVDDLKPGAHMAKSCGVPFAGAGWSHTVPEVAEDLKQYCDYYLRSTDELRHLLFD